MEKGRAWYRRGDSTLCYFFTVEEIEDLVAGAAAGGERDEEGRPRWRMEGKAVMHEREMENKGQGWGCTRRFVHGSWTKVAVE